MADELDPRLEARLREALHAEGDALPLRIREQDVLRARNRRRARRWGVPASLLAAAAVVAVLVATGVLGRGDPTGVGGSPSPSPAPSERPLASYEDLLAVIGPVASAALQGEGETPGDAGGSVETDLGPVLVTPTLKLAASCLGGELTVLLRADGAELGSHHVGCSLQGPFASTIDPFAATPAVEARVVVIAPKGMRWRIVVADPFTDGSSPNPSASTGPGIVRPSPGSGETPLVWFELDALRAIDTGVAVPDGTDEILVAGQCAGEGETTIEIDGVRAVYPCANFGPVVFVPDNTWLDIRASATGSALFAIQVSARDLERFDGAALRLSTQVLEQCGSEGGCAFYADVRDGQGLISTVKLDPRPGVRSTLPRGLPVGVYTLTFRSSLVSDITTSGSPPDQSADAACSTTFDVAPGQTLIRASGIFRADSCEIAITAS